MINVIALRRLILVNHEKNSFRTHCGVNFISRLAIQTNWFLINNFHKEFLDKQISDRTVPINNIVSFLERPSFSLRGIWTEAEEKKEQRGIWTEAEEKKKRGIGEAEEKQEQRGIGDGSGREKGKRNEASTKMKMLPNSPNGIRPATLN